MSQFSLTSTTRQPMTAMTSGGGSAGGCVLRRRPGCCLALLSSRSWYGGAGLRVLLALTDWRGLLHGLCAAALSDTTMR